jgi:hypothetical protein
MHQASMLRKVQKRLGCPRSSLGALSEAVDVFDPTRLAAIIGELLDKVPRARSIGRDALPQVLTAVDSSVVRTLANLAEAAYLTYKNGQTHCGWRFHTHFEIGHKRGLPTFHAHTRLYTSNPRAARSQGWSGPEKWGRE